MHQTCCPLTDLSQLRTLHPSARTMSPRLGCKSGTSSAQCAGTKLKTEGQQQQAQELYRRAVSLHGKYAPGHYNLAVLLVEQGQVCPAVPSQHTLDLCRGMRSSM